MPSSLTSAGETSKTDENSIDVSLLKELAKRSLVDALNSVNGAKTLVLDPSLAGPLGLVTEVSLLKHHGVDKMFWLEAGPLTATTTNIIYLCRPLIKWVKIVAEQVKKHASTSQKHTYTLLLTPRSSTLVNRVLEEEGVLGDINVSAYNLQFIPVEDDVLSLEVDNAFREIWVDGDETIIYNSAQALLTLQRLYGMFPRVIGKGDHAAKLARLLRRISTLPPISDESITTSTTSGKADTLSPSDKIDSLIILDRRVDMITPLLTQLTYEGLIDEFIGVKNSHVELPASLLTPSNTQSSTPSTSTTPATAIPKEKEKKKKHLLTTATDPYFAELRDLNFATVGSRLHTFAKRLEGDYQGRHQAKTVAQLREFVGRLGGLQNEHQSLTLHTGLSEMLIPFTRTEHFNKSLEIQQNLIASYDTITQLNSIEDLIAQGVDIQLILRLVCLANITAGGFKLKTLEALKREILQTYGYQHLPTLLTLSSLHLLHPSPIPAASVPYKLPFSNLRKQLRLMVDDVSEESPNDIAYVYSGYAPMSVRLVQCVAQKGSVVSTASAPGKDDTGDPGAGATKGTKARAHPIVGWKGFEDVVASIPGEVVDIAQATEAPSPLASLLPKEESTTTVVFFLGGCTFTEIAALRWMGKQVRGRKFLIATTGLINGNSLMDSLSPVVPAKTA